MNKIVKNVQVYNARRHQLMRILSVNISSILNLNIISGEENTGVNFMPIVTKLLLISHREMPQSFLGQFTDLSQRKSFSIIVQRETESAKQWNFNETNLVGIPWQQNGQKIIFFCRCHVTFSGSICPWCTFLDLMAPDTFIMIHSYSRLCY